MNFDDQLYNDMMILEPLNASFNLDHRFDAEYLSPYTQKYRIMAANFINKYKNIKMKIKYKEILDYILDNLLRFINLPFYLKPVNHINNPFKEIIDLLEYERLPVNGIESFKIRLYKFIETIKELKENILKGLSQNITESKITIKLLIDYLDSLNFSKINKKYNEFIILLNGPFKECAIDFSNFLKNNLERFSNKFGLCAVADKNLRRKMYQYLVDSSTNLHINFDDILNYGIEQVEIYNVFVLKNNKVRDKYLKSKFKTSEEIVKAYKEKNKEIEKKLGHYFTYSKIKNKIRIISEKNEPVASYAGPDIFLKKQGTFNINIIKPSDFFIGDVLFLSGHENFFGHGYQIPMSYINLKNSKRPLWTSINNWSSTIEGWGLYIEWFLLNTNEIEKTDIEVYGLVNSIQLRNIRLVVDVLINYYEYGPLEIYNYIKKYVYLSEEELISEIYRYSAIPGQAVSYSMALGHIIKISKKYKNIKKFHDYFIENSWKPICFI